MLCTDRYMFHPSTVKLIPIRFDGGCTLISNGLGDIAPSFSAIASLLMSSNMVAGDFPSIYNEPRSLVPNLSAHDHLLLRRHDYIERGLNPTIIIVEDLEIDGNQEG